VIIETPARTEGGFRENRRQGGQAILRRSLHS